MIPTTGIAGCCARAASGHAAAPPSSVMNSRRLMGLPPSFRTLKLSIALPGWAMGRPLEGDLALLTSILKRSCRRSLPDFLH